MKPQPILFYGIMGQFGFLRLAYEHEIIDAETPREAKKLGKKQKMLIKQQWQNIKEQIMMKGLRAKFSQNQTIKQKLLATYNRQLRQHTGRDKYWGDGGKKYTGKNRLGILLMKLRDQLKKKK